MSEELLIQSSTGPYTVEFSDALPDEISLERTRERHFLIDANVARLYAQPLCSVIDDRNTLVIDATEENKSVQGLIPTLERLIEHRVRREHLLVAIGGGIIQDITCFIASTLLRGVPWIFVPTTLLAQADSCIGSKSSINLGSTKNVLGTFNPPRKVFVCSGFLDTLEHKDICSGVGEIIKVHAIEGPTAFNRLASDFERLFSDRTALLGYIRAALRIKQRYVERDEFDRGIRNIFNYGHSFGHAIESVTRFAVPHGIAVTIGMDMANDIAAQRGLLSPEHRDRMRPILQRNYADYARTPIAFDGLLAALKKDKKNTSSALRLVLPVGPDATIQVISIEPDDRFQAQCRQFLDTSFA